MKIISIFQTFRTTINRIANLPVTLEQQSLMLGRLLSESVNLSITSEQQSLMLGRLQSESVNLSVMLERLQSESVNLSVMLGRLQSESVNLSVTSEQQSLMLGRLQSESVNLSVTSEQQSLMLGRLLSESVKSKKRIACLSEVEFKVFSQFGDDGIIQWLVNNLEFPNRTFIELGVGNYRESNTRFLMMNNNWSGLVMDSSESNVAQIINSEYFWKHELLANAVFIDTDNINRLIASSLFDKEVGIFHIDLDGNDYWIWKQIDVVSPIVVILEYNSVFGIDRAITIPYDKVFYRTNAHYSNLYFGTSLRALYQLSANKGYSFIGCNSAGNNAYFVRKDKLNEIVREISLENGYVLSKFRESRDRVGRLNYLTGNDRMKAIRGMPVYNIDTNKIEKL